MSKETRTVRPFTGIERLAGVLDETLLHFGPDTCLANGSIAVDVPAGEFLVRPVTVEWGSDEQAFGKFKERIETGAEAAGFNLEDLSLIVVGSSPFLKIADIVFTCPLTALGDLARVVILTEDRRSAAFRAPFSGFNIDVYVVLARSLTPKLLRPYLFGTWIAQSQFRVYTTQGSAVLPPTPLTAEIREQHRLLAKTVKYLYFGDHNVLEPQGQQELPIFYVDERLLAQMNARRTSPASKALQLQLAHDFVSAVIQRASVAPDLDDMAYDDIRGSLLGSAIRIAAGPGATDEDRSRLMRQVRTNSGYVIARAEHFIDLASGYGAIIVEEES